MNLLRQRAKQASSSAGSGGGSAAARLLMREVPTLIESLPAVSEGQLTLTFAEDPNSHSGLWAGGRFVFRVDVAPDYPFGRSNVKCLTPVYHPNINEEGSVCLNILREDFSPAIHIEQMCQGMLFLMLHPNAESPLNDLAAREMLDAPDLFAQHVRVALSGGTLHGRRYSNCLEA
ncbi:Ubiquitinconjugating enzyme subfamily protein [Acanthamoeba castellanii str. Neff]|uniref:Ubiquitinconjugating enzyme subfamily protein n=1 Tax=Acanthamoeba castellanii (strain ATCC 30010 / Neff) TaxID=1257118 RepID=L8GLR3_ACACF|nr:Ubiquitinconjugating enzyme subfamily protein [Acanthamoeba castellanii str. Neff]ELR13967.1 Ubiquitinconjugating enzyme subfamily protein [Acanthamoeba castellanii str. Neff]